MVQNFWERHELALSVCRHDPRGAREEVLVERERSQADSIAVTDANAAREGDGGHARHGVERARLRCQLDVRLGIPRPRALVASVRKRFVYFCIRVLFSHLNLSKNSWRRAVAQRKSNPVL